MTEAIIRLPGNIDVAKIPEELLYKAFAIAVSKQKKELKRELKQIDSKIKKFEKRYKKSLSEFESTMGDSVKEHDDWMDWSFLDETRKQILKDMENFDKV